MDYNVLERGAVASVQTVFDLSRRWYGGRFDLDWERPDPADVQATFAEFGLVGPFWEVT